MIKDVLCVLPAFISHIINEDSFLCWNDPHADAEKMFKEKYYRKRGRRQSSIPE